MQSSRVFQYCRCRVHVYFNNVWINFLSESSKYMPFFLFSWFLFYLHFHFRNTLLLCRVIQKICRVAEMELFLFSPCIINLLIPDVKSCTLIYVLPAFFQDNRREAGVTVSKR